MRWVLFVPMRRKMFVIAVAYEYTFIIIQKRMQCKAVTCEKQKEIYRKDVKKQTEERGYQNE